jgi:hypothetical protein
MDRDDGRAAPGRARRRRRPARSSFVLCAALLTTMASPPAMAVSAADPVVSTGDADDTDGRLDLKYFAAQNDSVNESIFVKVRTELGFRCSYLSPKTSPNRITVLFDDGHDSTIETTGRFVCVRDRFKGHVRRQWELWTSYTHCHLRARHPAPRTVAADVTYACVEGVFEDDGFGIAARSRDATAPRCQDSPCLDRAPESGTLKLW